jgi:hypothetical protein
VLLADEARLRAAGGDQPRAWSLAVRALSLDPEDRELRYLVESLEQAKTLAWTPQAEYFQDNRDRRNWFLHQKLESLASGRLRWSATHLHGFFSEAGLPNTTDDGGGLGLAWSWNLYHTLTALAEGHHLSGPAKDTYSVEAGLQSRWTDHFETGLNAGRAPYPTGRALRAGISEQHADGRIGWTLGKFWKSEARGRYIKLTDDNERYAGSLEISRLLGLSSGWRGLYRFAAEDTEHVSASYYSPQRLMLQQLGLSYKQNWRSLFTAEARYLPGFGEEHGGGKSFIQVADVTLGWTPGRSFALRPSFSMTRTPSYHSYSYSLAATQRF